MRIEGLVGLDTSDERQGRSPFMTSRVVEA